MSGGHRSGLGGRESIPSRRFSFDNVKKLFYYERTALVLVPAGGDPKHAPCQDLNQKGRRQEGRVDSTRCREPR